MKDVSSFFKKKTEQGQSENLTKRKQNEPKYVYVKVVIFLRKCAEHTVKWEQF